jgi:hypothetical protein
MKRLLPLLAAVAAASGCGGGHHASALDRANVALLDKLPAYPGAAAPRTSTSGETNTAFGARDWRLPANARAAVVVAWYADRLHARGWRIADKNDTGLRAFRGGASLSVGVRGRTLELIANAQGAPKS